MIISAIKGKPNDISLSLFEFSSYIYNCLLLKRNYREPTTVNGQRYYPVIREGREPLFMRAHMPGVVMDRKRVVQSLLLTVLFNTVIALFLTHLEYGKGFAVNLIVSQCIGLSICAAILAGHFMVDTSSPLKHFFMILAAMVIGAVLGSLIGAGIAGFPLKAVFQGKPTMFFQLVSIGILFGAIITYFFFSQAQISETRQQVQDERIKRLDSEKKALEAHLKMLQAQIEPHFLFNSLSTVLSLLDTDAKKAGCMLTDLIHYLRVSLSKTRGENTTIHQEMEMIRAYLDIWKIRMGHRLEYHFHVADDVKALAIPPMLVQPLVENALKHGLEPAMDGGRVEIVAVGKKGGISITVADTGQGLDEFGDAGFGLGNIRDRLRSLYGGNARLVLSENQPKGLKATIEIPL